MYWYQQHRTDSKHSNSAHRRLRPDPTAHTKTQVFVIKRNFERIVTLCRLPDVVMRVKQAIPTHCSQNQRMRTWQFMRHDSAKLMSADSAAVATAAPPLPPSPPHCLKPILATFWPPLLAPTVDSTSMELRLRLSGRGYRNS